MTKAIYVGNLSFSASEEEVEEMFAQYGTVVSVKLMRDREGRSRGYAFVRMESEEALEAMIGLDGKVFKGRNIHINWARGLQNATDEEFGEIFV